MRIAILLCDSFAGILPESIPSYPWMFRGLFNGIRRNLRYSVYCAYSGELPPTERGGFDLYLVTGSRASALDKVPWIAALESWIREAHAGRLKLAGVCFGHQVIAQALGGKVEKAPQGLRAGVHSVRTQHPGARLYFPAGSFSLIYCHQDQVTRPPSSAQVFAGSDSCPCAGLLVGDHILTFQGHPEFTPAYFRFLLSQHPGDTPPEVAEQALESLDEPTHHRQAAKWILSL